jgi:signal transduction histidine kinase/ActR/RegA family two-component response regulator
MNPHSASGRLPPIDRSLHQQIRAEQLRMLLGQSTPVTVLATIFACLLAQYASAYVPVVDAMAWLVLKVVVAMPRLALAYWFNHRHIQPSKRIHTMAVGLLLIDGLAWGMAGIVLMPVSNQQESTIIAACLMGVTALATFNLHANWVANAAYCVPLLLPAALHLFGRQDNFGLFTGTALLVFLGGLLTVARRAQQHIIEMLWRRFLMDRVVADKDAALEHSERQHAIKSQFVATMSHELRTPLHGILGLTRILLDDFPRDNQREQLALVHRSGDHLLSIINHILDFSKIDAGHLQIERHPFDLHELMQDVIKLTTVPARAKGLSLVGEVSLPCPCWVVGDASRVRQVLLNLVGNAIKFTDRGSILIRGVGDSTTGHFVAEVHDSGIGIAECDLEAIFDPYKQAQNAIGNAMGGTGLGLTISREISRAMGGDITCKSAMGKGSVFSFSAILPATQKLSTATLKHGLLKHPRVASDHDAGFSDAFLRGHVLLAEDNEVNALIVESQLKQLGLTVEVVRNGQEAVHRLSLPNMPRLDLVLMDCQMPLMDGFECTRQLRAHERSLNLGRMPVIALTASAMAEDSERCLNAGMDAHLSKPFKDEELARLLRHYLTRHDAELSHQA